LQEIALIVRSSAQLERAKGAVELLAKPFRVLDERVDTVSGHIHIMTMHLAKGLEFRAVCVMACDDEVLPLQDRVENVSDEGDLEDVYATG
jgi:superfamily I DNA/RNA helicase